LLLYLKRDGEIDPTDANGTPVSEYIEKFNGYDVPFKAGISLKPPHSSKTNNPRNIKPLIHAPQGLAAPQTVPSSICDRWPWDSNNFDDSLADRWKNMMP
jgi:hypothetical protein